MILLCPPHEEGFRFPRGQAETPKSEARQREIKVMKAMEDLTNLGDEGEYKRILAEEYGIIPGHPRYEKAMAAWKELQRERKLFTRSTSASVLAFFSASERPISSICSSRRRAIAVSTSSREAFRRF